jgi:hypothetical protein
LFSSAVSAVLFGHVAALPLGRARREAATVFARVVDDSAAPAARCHCRVVQSARTRRGRRPEVKSRLQIEQAHVIAIPARRTTGLLGPCDAASARAGSRTCRRPRAQIGCSLMNASSPRALCTRPECVFHPQSRERAQLGLGIARVHAILQKTSSSAGLVGLIPKFSVGVAPRSVLLPVLPLCIDLKFLRRCRLGKFVSGISIQGTECQRRRRARLSQDN